jgi:hypothetical protein
MTIDLDAYSGSKKAIHAWLASRKKEFLLSNITSLAVFTHCPCIVVAYYAGEQFGFSEELVAYIVQLKKFYGYTKILNKPEGSP